MSLDTRKRFVAALAAIEPDLEALGFRRRAIEEQGFATWLMYSRPDVDVEFVCGPPEYHIDMLIRVGQATYELADLMKRRPIGDWMTEHELKSNQQDALRSEAEWFGALLRVVLARL